MKSNGTFEITNLPNFINEFYKTEKGILNTNGKWKVGKDFEGKKWVLELEYTKSSLFEKGMSIEHELFEQNNKIIIWKFIGDPDSGERFLFKKK